MKLMKNQLTLFQRKTSNGHPCKSFVLISWHPNWSITWSWLIDWSSRYISHGLPIYYLRYGGYKGWYFSCGIKLQFLGHLSFSNQPTIKRVKK